MNIDISDRIKNFPPYLFAKIDEMKRDVLKRGVEIIDFGVGDPDLPTPDFVVDALKEGLTQPNYHRYPSYSGAGSLKKIIAEWFEKRFGVRLNPDKEVIVLIGSKEGIAHFPLAMINPGENGLYTSPGYPVYRTATLFSGGNPIPVPLTIENQFLPDLSKIKEPAKLFFLNYPNNPTSATASLEFFKELTAWAKKRNTILCHDAAYSEIYFGKTPSPSLLQIPGAKDISIEFHSLSKSFNMTGWRLGFAVGNEKLIDALGKIKTNIDSGQFLAIQHAAGQALLRGDSFIESQRKCFERRRDLMVQGLSKLGLKVFPCNSTFYLWTQVPKPYTSLEFCQHLLNTKGIVTTPGHGFGPEGEGYVRFSLTVPDEDILKAIKRLES